MRVVLSFLFLIALTLGGAWYAQRQLELWSIRSQELAEAVVVKVPRGTSLGTLSGILADQGVVSDALFFRIWVRLYSKYSEFQAGQYRFEGAISPAGVAKKIRKGEVYRPVVLELTIPEGFRLEQIVDRFVAAGIGSKEDFRQLLNDTQFLSELGVNGASAEGFFYPATYRFYERPDPAAVLRKGISTFFKKLPDGYEEQVEALGLSLYEAVTFASLIELETKYDDERPKVAEVIWRRLKDKVPLAIDATIIYGIPDYQGNLSHSHLRDRANPYNTRVHVGFPPSPIGAPSVESLKAILSPSDDGYYYYVVDAEQGDRHHFSKTLKEHNQWVRKLVSAQRDARREERRRELEERREAARAEREAKRAARTARRDARQEALQREREEREARRDRAVGSRAQEAAEREALEEADEFSDFEERLDAYSEGAP